MKSLAKLYLALAQAFANLMATPKRAGLAGLQKDAAFLCQVAKLDGLPKAVAVSSEHAALGQLALALADVLEPPRTPVELYNELGDLGQDVVMKLHAPGKGGHYEANHLRWLVSVYVPEAAPTQADLVAENARLRLLLEQATDRAEAAQQTATEFEQMAAELTKYAPEVEARRADYDQLTEALILMARLESEPVNSRLDVTGLYEGDEGHFIKAFHAHLRTLTVFNLDWFNPRTLRKFYTEMRLWHDQLQLETQQKHKAAA